MNLISRAEWGARPPKYVTPISASEGIFVHYTVTPTAPEAQIVRNVQSFHMDSHGWSDIAYSFLVGQSGDIYEGRGWGRAGGHTEGWNSRSHAVCWIGNSETPTQAALESINAVIEDHHRRYGAGFVRPHRAVNNTSCPGDALDGWLSAGRPLASTPEPPTEEDDDMSALVTDPADGKVWHVKGLERRYVGHPDDVRFLLSLGASDMTAAPEETRRRLIGNTEDVAAKVVVVPGGVNAKAVADELHRRLAG